LNLEIYGVNVVFICLLKFGNNLYGKGDFI